MGERIAVTGASGFIGRAVTQLGATRGLEVVGLTRSEAGARAVSEAGGRPEQIPGLVREAMARGFAGARAVIHLAQIGAERGAVRYEAVNVQGTRAVIEAARDAGVERIVFLSGLGVTRYGMSRRCSNAYFLSKLSCEAALFRSGIPVAVLRPSYVVGPGGELVPDLLAQLKTGTLERIGDGVYRFQPVGVADAAAAVLAAARDERDPLVLDLVGPEAVSFREFVERLVGVTAPPGRRATFRVREIPVEEAERRAAAGGYRGMLPDELDCLLCDEIGDARPLEALLGRALAPLDEALAASVGGG